MRYAPYPGNTLIQKKLPLIAIYAAFGLSGFAALIYQITWIRELGTFFGIQVYSSTTVLAAFMSGLALGSWIFGKLSDRIRDPLLLFILMEISLAVYALAFPWIKALIADIYLLVAPDPSSGVFVQQIVRFASAFPLLLIATSIMGGTLPVLTKGITEKTADLGQRISLLYGSNNLGAFFGGIVTGYFLLKSAGISGSLWIGASLNALNAIMVLTLKPGLRSGLPGKMPHKVPFRNKHIYSRRTVRIVLWVFAIEGFTTLAYEIIWTRIMHEFSYDKTSFFYTTIITAFVGGLALGSYYISRFINRIKDPLKMLGKVQFWIGMIYLLNFILFITTAPWFHELRENQATWLRTIGAEQVYVFLIVLPPVVLMGFTFPLVSIIYNNSSDKIGSDIGTLGALDTIGSVAGSVLTGFLLIPLAGSVNAFLIIVIINILLSAWIFQYVREKFPLKRMVAYCLFFLLALVIVLPRDTEFINKRWNHILENAVIYYKEGPAASVAVTKYRNTHAALSINGAITAYTIPNDVQVHKMLAVLPYIHSNNPDKALVVGLGIGITANTLNKADIPHITIAEISPGVVNASKHIFGYFNHTMAGNPTIYMEDGRAHLYRTEHTYDIITTNAIHPRLGNNIYTKDFYELCLRKLSENGVMCQWIPTNWMTYEEYRILIRSFTEVFNHASLWIINDAHTIILGSSKCPGYSITDIEEKLVSDSLVDYLEQSYYMNVTDILKHFCMKDEQLNKFTSGVALNSDDKPVIEFSHEINRAPNKQILTSLKEHACRVSEVYKEPAPDTMKSFILQHKQDQLLKRLENYLLMLEND
ncbi:MAG: fused MFS/spermidine synthase [Bacteroidales bacterium]|nr:fused MFS/spermidine synthase [Bacteroidales bacterium]